MRRIKKKIWKTRGMAIGLSVSVLLGMLPGYCAKADEAIADIKLQNPRIEKAFSSGQLVEWDTICFGSYPQTEVATGEAVYQQLVGADEWDEKGDIVIDGIKYRRLNKSQAISDKGFLWEDDTTYHYFQYEPIKWRVLETKEGESLLLSDVILDNQKFNETYEFMPWDKSTLRSWLNGYGADSNKNAKDYRNYNFIDTAFSQEEQDMIAVTAVRNDDNYVYDSVEDATTQDKIFLLSSSQAYQEVASDLGFVADEYVCDEARRCQASDYANAMGTTEEKDGIYDGNSIWWLRTPGKERFGMYVESSGKVNTLGYVVNSKNYGVRVAITLNLSQVEYERYAGKLQSDGQIRHLDFVDNVTLQNPIIEKTGKPMVSQQIVTWDSVYMGNYPQSEVVSSDGVYASLVTADGWDENQEIILNGVRYRRIKQSDATYSRTYGSYEAFLTNPEGYYWEDQQTYHYFVFEPIRWRVLKVDDTRALLLSDLILDNQKYAMDNLETTWETSYMREWLNEQFVNCAFSKEEQAALLENPLSNSSNSTYGTGSGNSTMDKIFLLAEEDLYMENAIGYGFMQYNLSDEARRCQSSMYARAMGVSVKNDERYENSGYWWLRTAGFNGTYVCGVDNIGQIDDFGVSANSSRSVYGMRPAIMLDLNAVQCYSVADQIRSDEMIRSEQNQDDTPEQVPDEEQDEALQVKKGDINGDAQVTLQDAQLALKAALKIIGLEGNQVKAADVTGEGKVELNDAQKILKVALKIETFNE